LSAHHFEEVAATEFTEWGVLGRPETAGQISLDRDAGRRQSVDDEPLTPEVVEQQNPWGTGWLSSRACCA